MSAAHDTDSRGPDPELEALPKPRQPWRRLTLVVMVATAFASIALIYDLRAELAYAFRGGPPLELGQLGTLSLDSKYENHWVHASGPLGATALTYRRPLDGDQFRLVPALGNENLWVEVRIPAGYDPARFIPPSSFVGRLVPIGKVGLGYEELSSPQTERSLAVPSDAWVLLDGEAPEGTHWVIGVTALLIGFLGFNIFGVVRIVRPVRDSEA